MGDTSMTDKQAVRAMRDVVGEQLTPNWRVHDIGELEGRGLVTFRDGCWKYTPAGKKLMEKFS